jgi:hypothetical protein
MGPPSARRKRTTFGQMRAAAAPIPGSAIRTRLINPAGFDKAKPQAIRAISPAKSQGQRKSPAVTAGLLNFRKRRWS